MDYNFLTLQIIFTSLVGGIVRYLVDFLRKAQSVEKLSLGLLIIHAIIGLFAGYMSFLLCTFFTTAEVAGILAAGIGSFGSYGTLFWILDRAKQQLVIMDKVQYEKFKKYNQNIEDEPESKRKR